MFIFVCGGVRFTTHVYEYLAKISGFGFFLYRLFALCRET